MGQCQKRMRRPVSGGAGYAAAGAGAGTAEYYNRRSGVAAGGDGGGGGAASAPTGSAAASGSNPDMVSSMSGGYGQGYIYEEECPEGIDEDLALLLTAAAIAAGMFIVYRDITLRLMGRRRREAEGERKNDLAEAFYVGRWRLLLLVFKDSFISFTA